MTSEADVTAALDLAKESFGSEVNVAVNCAGILLASRVLGKKGPHDLEKFLKVWEDSMFVTNVPPIFLLLAATIH